jgi:hypothetical protein
MHRTNPDEEMEMTKIRLIPALALVALVGMTACKKADSSADVVTQDTITTPGTETVTVPNADTAVVTTTVDTSATVDTTHVSK